MKILLIEDEPDLALNIRKSLSESGYAVDIAEDGEKGIFMAETEDYDLILLDWMLPKASGIAVCEQIRSNNQSIPILMLTSKSNIEDKVQGFSSGADDYLTKPFSLIELEIRIKALLKRKDKVNLSTVTIDNLEIDLFKHLVSRDGNKIELTPKEFAILELLVQHKDGIVSRAMILDHVWDSNYEGDSNIVDVLVGTLRRKIDTKTNKKLIHTVYGLGFKLSENE